jgi:hypothetical protein
VIALKRSEVRNAKDVTTGKTKICEFKVLRHPSVMLRNSAFGPYSVFHVLHTIIKRDGCYFCKQRQLAGICKGDVAEVVSEIFYVT